MSLSPFSSNLLEAGDLVQEDVPLTDEGILLVSRVRMYTLNSIKPVIAMTSPLVRARQSAELLGSDHKVTVDTDLGLGDSNPWNSAFRTMRDNASGKEQYENAPDLVGSASRRLIAKAQELTKFMLPRKLAICVSHCPLVDTVYALLKKDLEGRMLWLPHQVPYAGIVLAHFYREGTTHKIEGVRYIPPPSI